MSDSTPDNPLVSCIMVTGGAPIRQELGQRALRAFRMQSYAPRELVIVNQSCGLPFQYQLIPGGHEQGPGYEIRESLVPRLGTLGDLRNIGLTQARGDWLTSWDDDDWSHPQRLQLQLDRRDGDRAVAFTTTIRCSLKHRTAFVMNITPHGNGGLILFPRGPWRYPSLESGEDSKFYLDNFFSDVVLWNNSDFPELYLRFYHGQNTTDARHILGPQHYARRTNPKLRFLGPGFTPKSQAYLSMIWDKEYGPNFLCCAAGGTS